MIRITTFAGRDVAVFGLGASGNATVQSLVDGGARVSAWDDSAAGRDAAQKAGVPLADLNTADWSKFVALVLAPGVPLTHPEPHWTVVKARQAGVEVIGDVELFCRERTKVCPQAPFIAITGTNGKSTTTALVAHILREAGKDVQLGGNIGRAVLTLDPLAPERYYVVECSSFQIDLAPAINPSVGVLLNITPDHLDRHGTIENYAAVKERLVAHAEFAVIGIDDGFPHKADRCEVIFHDLEHKDRPVAAFTRRQAQMIGMTFFQDGCLRRAVALGENVCDVERLAELRDAKALRGSHNAENAAAAFLACERLGLSRKVIEQGLVTFPGLAHRMEQIGQAGRIVFVNDSKATNAESTEKALSSWDNGIFVILGGKPKDGGIEALRPYFPRIARAYLIGVATPEFAASLGADVPYETCETMDRAVAAAARDAAASAFAEPVVLLSPACASYDQYKNFEQRGDHFRRLVAALPGTHT
jgi:UDP-N-acetylmuramoylalanine--D-glutamate ligase